MSLLPQLTHLGKLEIIEVYEYYDIPCLFACRNKSGQILLAVWGEQTEEFGIWVYVPISQSRFEYVRSGKIELRDAFLNSEDGFVYKVIIPCDRNHDKVETVFVENLNDDWLPIPGEFLNFGARSLPNFDVKETNFMTT